MYFWNDNYVSEENWSVSVIVGIGETMVNIKCGQCKKIIKIHKSPCCKESWRYPFKVDGKEVWICHKCFTDNVKNLKAQMEG